MNDSLKRRNRWEDKYLSGETGWDRGESSPALRQWLDEQALPPGRVLVPGCGHGYEISLLAERGWQVSAVDISAPPVERLKRRLADEGLSAEVIQADLLHWEPDAPFDLIYEQTCLCALEPAHWAEYEQRLARWLRPGGLLLALFMQTGRHGGPPFHCDLLRMRELFAESRWDWPAQTPLAVPHHAGVVELGHRLVRRS